MTRISRLMIALLLSVTIADVASAQGRKVQNPTGWSVGGGIGAAASPGQFLLELDAPYRFSNLLSVGPTFLLGAGSGLTTVALSLDGKIHVDVFGGMNNFLADLTPYGGIGVGFSHYSASRFGETSFLLPIIIGAEYDLTKRLAITSDMRFNVVATSNVDKFFWSWQIVGARFRF